MHRGQPRSKNDYGVEMLVMLVPREKKLPTGQSQWDVGSSQLNRTNPSYNVTKIISEVVKLD